MATIQENLSTLASIKSDIASAIVAKGGTVTDAFGGFAQAIADLPSGGGTEIEDAMVEGTLSGVYVNNRVSQVGDYAFYSNSTITGVEMNNVRTLGNNCFYSCKSLVSIELTNATTLSYNVFASCSALTSVNLPNATTLGNSCFNHCNSLVSISLPMASTIGAYCFQSCSKLANVELPLCESVGISAFHTCGSLVSISVPNLKTIGQSAFRGCVNLSSISLPKLSNFGIGYNFSGCDSLSYVYLGSSSVLTSMSSTVFNLCHKSLSIYVPISLYSDYISKFGSYQVSLSGSTRAYSSIIVGAGMLSVSYVDGTIGNVPWAKSSLGHIQNATRITDLDGVITFIDSRVYSDGKISSIEYLSLSGVSYIGYNGFLNYAALSEVHVDNLTSMSTSCFQNCTSLKSIELPRLSIVNVQCFQGCSALEYVSLPIATHLLYGAFYNCKGLQSIDLPMVSSIGENCFCYCYNLSFINLGSTSIAYICTNGYALEYCHSMLSIEVPASLLSDYIASYGSWSVTLSGNIKRYYSDIFFASES